MAKQTEAEAERAGTEYVILKGITLTLYTLRSLDESAVVVPDSDGEDETILWLRRPGTVTASNKESAVTKGTTGLSAAEKTGNWKAVSASAWKGGEHHEAEEVVTTKRTPFED